MSPMNEHAAAATPNTPAAPAAPDLCLIHVAVADAATAERLARQLVTERLAACVSISGPETAFFHWNGALDQRAEYALWLKTRRTLATAAIDRVSALHPDACPGVLALPIFGGAPDFLRWIDAETSPAPHPSAPDGE